MNRSDSGRITVPDELREILLEFTISYLLEQPPDIIDYAVEFFHKLQDNRGATIIRLEAAGSPDESVISQEEGNVKTSAAQILSVLKKTDNA